jgi:hypothetical protein
MFAIDDTGSLQRRVTILASLMPVDYLTGVNRGGSHGNDLPVVLTDKSRVACVMGIEDNQKDRTEELTGQRVEVPSGIRY